MTTAWLASLAGIAKSETRGAKQFGETIIEKRIIGNQFIHVGDL